MHNHSKMAYVEKVWGLLYHTPGSIRAEFGTQE